MKILIIKLTSMGDLMHALPAITEASHLISNLQFDWVVDDNFSEVPSWHPNVHKIITTNHRSWKKHIFNKTLREEVKILKETLNKNSYDLVIDMQNNLKSAYVSYLYKGNVSGMDRSSVREFPAHWAYSKTTSISKDLHAIQRQKILLSDSLGYSPNKNEIDYGIDKLKFIEPLFKLPIKFVVLVQNASWPTKLWSIENWKELILYIQNKGLVSLLPSGNHKELVRAQEIVKDSDAHALDLMSLNELGFILDKAKFCVCSDTGLAHLSAVVGTPSITLYGPTDVNLIGTKGLNQRHIIGENKKMDNILPKDVFALIEDLIS